MKSQLILEQLQAYRHLHSLNASSFRKWTQSVGPVYCHVCGTVYKTIVQGNISILLFLRFRMPR